MRLYPAMKARNTRLAFVAIGVALCAIWFTLPSAYAEKKQAELPSPPPPISDAEREDMQTRIINDSRETVFTALTSVLSLDGWTIEDRDADHGMIRASSRKTQASVGPQNDWILTIDSKETQMKLLKKPERREYRIRAWTRWVEMSTVVESWQGTSSRVRISITKMGLTPVRSRKRGPVVPFSVTSNTSSNASAAIGIALDEPEPYRQLFERIETELSSREKVEPQP